MSPNNMPTAIRAIPPNTRRRRALIGAKVSVIWRETTWVDITRLLLAVLLIGQMLRSISRHFCGGRSKSRHHALCEDLLRLNALPIFESAKIRNNRQFADAALSLQVFDLPDDLLRRSDESNFLLYDFVVRQPG